MLRLGRSLLYWGLYYWFFMVTIVAIFIACLLLFLGLILLIMNRPFLLNLGCLLYPFPLSLFFPLLLLSLILFLTPFPHNFAADLIIIDKHIPNDLAIGYIVIFLFDPHCPDKGLPAVLVISLFLLDLPVGLLEVRQPLRYLLAFESGAQNVDTCGRQHL